MMLRDKVLGVLIAAIWGETFNIARLAGMALIVLGVAKIVLASKRRRIALARQPKWSPLDHLPRPGDGSGRAANRMD